jgi:uncharacterized membrane protein YccF (DUF307 family)
MTLAFNLLWLVVAGWWLAILWLIASLALVLSIVGIPFAPQALKIASFVLWPFGRVAVARPDSAVPTLSAVGNIVWVVLVGWWLALAHVLAGIALCISILGIPLGVGMFKLVPITFAPFGLEIITEHPTLGDEGSRSVTIPAGWHHRPPPSPSY